MIALVQLLQVQWLFVGYLLVDDVVVHRVHGSLVVARGEDLGATATAIQEPVQSGTFVHVVIRNRHYAPQVIPCLC